jgi:hypothetical protein
MRFIVFLFLLALVAAGCGKSDAKLRREIVGTWFMQPSGSMIFRLDGSYHLTNALVSGSVVMTWVNDGTWNIENGFLVTAVTNSIAGNTDEKPAVGTVNRSKINYIDAHNLAYGDAQNGASYRR